MLSVDTHDHADRAYHYYHLLQDFYIFILSDLLITKFTEIYLKKKKAVIAYKLTVKINLCKTS